LRTKPLQKAHMQCIPNPQKTQYGLLYKNNQIE